MALDYRKLNGWRTWTRCLIFLSLVPHLANKKTTYIVMLLWRWKGILYAELPTQRRYPLKIVFHHLLVTCKISYNSIILKKQLFISKHLLLETSWPEMMSHAVLFLFTPNSQPRSHVVALFFSQISVSLVRQASFLFRNLFASLSFPQLFLTPSSKVPFHSRPVIDSTSELSIFLAPK